MSNSKPPFQAARGGLVVHARGDALLRSNLTNKGTAFSLEERQALGLVGLLPPRVESLDEQLARTWLAYRRALTPLEQYRFLRRLEDTNVVLFHALLAAHVEELLPVVYTPTVGEGVERWSEIWENARGVTITERADETIASVPNDDVRMIVATDGSAILGIGDQGYNGIAISIGKLALYTVGGGVSPYETLPVALDVGTDRKALREDPSYLGVRRERLRGDAYRGVVRSFVQAVKARWPRAIVQWEDFGKESAFEVLDAFRDELPSFNDDIQGTGAVALAGLLRAGRLRGRALADERFLVFGAGAGGIGVARAILGGLEREGLTREAALARIFVVDSKGLLVTGRAMESYKQAFAQPAREGWSAAPSLLETIERGRITALLGLSGQPGTFDEAVVHALLANAERPVVFALSNPTSACEALPADLLRWSAGRALVATGSPFEPVVHDDVTHVIGQGNNAFVFPGLGFGAMLTEARAVTDGMVAESAYALAELTGERWPDLVYPPVTHLRDAAVRVAARVAACALREGVATKTDLPEDLEAHARRLAWSPRYLPTLAG